MDASSLSNLANSISYWENDELERQMPSFMPSLLSSLDYVSLRNRAFHVVDQIVKRFVQSKVR